VTYEGLMGRAEELRRLAVEVTMELLERDPLRKDGVVRQFADVPDAFRAVAAFADPGKFDRAIDELQTVLEGLSMGDGGQVADPGLARIGSVAAMLGGWTGDAAERFRDGFLAPWPAFVRNQHAIAGVLRGALVAQREMWERARRDAEQIAEQGIHAVAASSDCTRTEWTVTFTVVSSVAAVLAVPLGPVAAGGVAAVGQVVAAVGPDEAPRTSFSGDDPGEVVERVREAIRTLLGQVHERLDATTRALRQTSRLMADRPELFGWQR
jgi:hypothetical protein